MTSEYHKAANHKPLNHQCAATTYHVGEEVRHRSFGVSVVTAVGNNAVVVRYGEQERTFVPQIAPLTRVGGAEDTTNGPPPENRPHRDPQNRPTRTRRSAAQLNRTTFSASRAAEYFDARQLSTLTGVPTHEFANVILKELVDNSLDACETAGTSPEISVAVGNGGTKGAICIRVTDNGPGIPSEVVRKLLDYNVRVSDKAAYRSPTRGAQGNALKTVIGIPYALGSRDPLTVVARGGIRHAIRPKVDPAGNVRVGNDESNLSPWSGGTSVDVPVVPGYVTDSSSEHLVQDFYPEHWVRSFAAFNPHATFRYKITGTTPKTQKFTNRPARTSTSTYHRSPRARTGTAPNRLRCSSSPTSPTPAMAARTCPWEPSCASLRVSRARKRRRPSARLCLRT